MGALAGMAAAAVALEGRHVDRQQHDRQRGERWAGFTDALDAKYGWSPGSGSQTGHGLRGNADGARRRRRRYRSGETRRRAVVAIAADQKMTVADAGAAHAGIAAITIAAARMMAARLPAPS